MRQISADASCPTERAEVTPLAPRAALTATGPSRSRRREHLAHWMLLATAILSGCSTAPARRPEPDAPPPAAELGRGMASWYGPGFHGRRTASGERFDMNDL